MEFLSPYYFWIKSFHIISVISWMAALLYLPRLFVYHAGPHGDAPATSETLKIMERRLRKAIMTPAMIATWIFGLLLIASPGVIFPGLPWWFILKFAALLLLTGFHGWLVKCQKNFESDRNEISSRAFRFANEVPTLLMIAIVILVVVKPL